MAWLPTAERAHPNATLATLKGAHRLIQRHVYKQNRAELDQEFYREGFLDGWEAGSQAALEYLATDEFICAYEEHFNPEHFSFSFDEDEIWLNRPGKDIAYRIGFSDSFDRGYQDTLKAVGKAFKEAKSQELRA